MLDFSVKFNRNLCDIDYGVNYLLKIINRTYYSILKLIKDLYKKKAYKGYWTMRFLFFEGTVLRDFNKI